MDRLVELANEAAKLKDDLNIISVEVNAMGMSIHLMDYVFDKYKAIMAGKPKSSVTTAIAMTLKSLSLSTVERCSSCAKPRKRRCRCR